MHISKNWIKGVLLSVVHLENTFLSPFDKNCHHCPYVGCCNGIFCVHNRLHYSHLPLNEHFMYKYLLEHVIHMLTSFSYDKGIPSK
jgi:hypothetical protein